MTKTILVADPDASIGELISSVFAGDYEITGARSLREAVEQLSSVRFDLIITEAFDQERWSDGLNLAFLARLKTTAPNTPVILFSTYVSTRMGKGCSCGLAGVLPKPTELDEIREKVSQAMGGQIVGSPSRLYSLGAIGSSSDVRQSVK